MEYPIVIEYVRVFKNRIADAFLRLDSVALENEVPADFEKSV